MSGPAGISAPLHRDVQVTRHFSLVNETPNNKPRLAAVAHFLREIRFEQTQSFCDWVSIYQNHPDGDLVKINDGAFVRYDAHGVHESTTLKKCKVEGSHETGVFVRCDGQTVWFEGTCPAPQVLNLALVGTVEISWDALCSIAIAIRPIVLGIAYLTAAFTFFGIGRKS